MSSNTFPQKPVKTFRYLLETRLDKQSHRITQLTEQARSDHHHNPQLAIIDVEEIIKYCNRRSANDRCAALYLIDSIVQTIGDPFKKLFENHIFGLIEATYRYGSMDTRYAHAFHYKKQKQTNKINRKSVCKLLSIWKDRQIFSISTLKQIHSAITTVANQAPPSIQHRPSPMSQYSADHLRMQHPIMPMNNYYHQQQMYPQPMSEWKQMTLEYGISSNDYYQQLNHVFQSLFEFFDNPYLYHNGLHVNSYKNRRQAWKMDVQLMNEFQSMHYQFSTNGKEITRSLDYCLQQLFKQGINVFYWTEILRRIAPQPSNKRTFDMMDKSKMAENQIQKRKKTNEICKFYVSNDGCRAGKNCNDIHSTFGDQRKKKMLDDRNLGRFHISDVVFDDRSLKCVTFYSLFCSGIHFDNNKNEYERKRTSLIMKRHQRSVTVLYSTKYLRACPNCGLRLTVNALKIHLKWHFNQRQFIEKKQMSSGWNKSKNDYRYWYKEKEFWIQSSAQNHRKLLQYNIESKINPFLNNISYERSAESVLSTGGGAYDDKYRVFCVSWPVECESSTDIVCCICEQSFIATCREYHESADEFVLSHACYADGTVKDNDDGGEDGNDGSKLPSFVKQKMKESVKDIVHRKCWEWNKKRNENLEIMESLRPNLQLAHFEAQMNEMVSVSVESEMDVDANKNDDDVKQSKIEEKIDGNGESEDITDEQSTVETGVDLKANGDQIDADGDIVLKTEINEIKVESAEKEKDITVKDSEILDDENIDSNGKSESNVNDDEIVSVLENSIVKVQKQPKNENCLPLPSASLSLVSKTSEISFDFDLQLIDMDDAENDNCNQDGNTATKADAAVSVSYDQFALYEPNSFQYYRSYRGRGRGRGRGRYRESGRGRRFYHRHY